MRTSSGFFAHGVLLALSLCAKAEAEPASEAALSLGVSPIAAEAGPSTEAVERCIADHERAQLFKLERRWSQARAALDRCASEACPLALRADCRDWLREIAALFASVVVIVESPPGTSEKVRATLDGAPVAIDTSGEAPLVLAPGSYELRFELPPHPPVKRSLVLREGEKSRVVRVRFAPEPARSTADAHPASQPESRAPIPLETYLLFGGAAVSASASAALLFSALSERDQARESCAPRCDTAMRESIERKLLLADISAGAALTFAVLATYTFLRRPRIPVSSPPFASPVLHLGVKGTALGVGVGGVF